MEENFFQEGVEGLKNRPREHSCSKYGEPFREKLLAVLQSDPPEGEKYWTRRLLAETLGVTQYVVHRYLQAEGICLMDQRPGRKETSSPEMDSSQAADGSRPQSEKDIPEEVPAALAHLLEDRTESLAGKDSGDDSYGLEVTIRIVRRDGTAAAQAAKRSEEWFPGADSFHGAALEEFRGDFDQHEKAQTGAFKKALGAVTEDFFNSLSEEHG